MPEISKCPQCERQLRVPDHLLGKKVKCPSCGTMFTAGAKKEIEAEVDDDVQVDEEEVRPRKKRVARVDDDDVEVESERDDEEEEEADVPRRKRRRRASRDRALLRITGPAIALIILASFDLVLVLVNLILTVAGVAVFPGAGKAGAADDAARMVMGVVGSIVGMCFAGLILAGAWQMKSLKGYGLAMTASILALLPCGNCCIFGLPLGIWALVVLNDAEVKSNFN